MKYTLILLIILLFIWLSYFVIKKLGLFDWFRTTWFYQTTFYKCISFPLKVYICPLIGGFDRPSEKEKIRPSCSILAMVYLFSVFGIVSEEYWSTDSHRMIQQINTNNFGTLSGEVLDLNRTSRRYSMVVGTEDGSSHVVEYSNPDNITSDIKGKYISINYIVDLLGDKLMVSAVLESKHVENTEEILKWRLERYEASIKWQERFLFFALILPWIRYWRCGLARFYSNSK